MFASVLLAFVATQRIENDDSVAAGGAGTVAATDGADLLRAAQSRSLAAQASAAIGGGSIGVAVGASPDDEPVEMVMSKIPTDTAPAAPTTETTVATTEAPATQPPTTRPATTRPPTTAAPTTPAPTEAASTEAPTTATADTAAAPATDPAAAADTATQTEPTTESTAPPATEPPATEPPATEPPPPPAHPEGWVDAGHGVFVPPVLLEIRFCESRDNYTAANPSSSARGAYQFLTGSWANYGHADRYGVRQAHLATPAQQDEAAVITWQRSGTRPWNASKHCWG